MAHILQAFPQPFTLVYLATKNGNGLVICAKFEAKGEMVVMQADTLPDIKIDGHGDMVYDPRLYLFIYLLIYFICLFIY